MYMLEGFRLTCVFTSINDSFFSFFVECCALVYNRFKKIVSVSDTSAVNFIASRAVGWSKFNCSVNLKKSTMSGLLMSHREKHHVAFSNSWRDGFLLKLCVSIYAAMKMLETKLLYVLIAVPWFFTDSAFLSTGKNFLWWLI